MDYRFRYTGEEETNGPSSVGLTQQSNVTLRQYQKEDTLAGAFDTEVLKCIG
jgi:hypothetical protein